MRRVGPVERLYPVIEFEAEISTAGGITLPRNLISRIQASDRVIVRIIQGRIPGTLRKRNVAEDEIEMIATTQLEERLNVVKFLQSEAALCRNKAFRHRSALLLQGRA